MEQSELEKLINKFNNEEIAGLTVQEQMKIYNALKDLALYQKIGTFENFINYKKIAQSIK